MKTIIATPGYRINVHDVADAVSNDLIQHFIFDSPGMDFVKEHVKVNDIFVDAGAHIGTYSLLAASLNCKVISFEPDIGNYTLLVKNKEENKYVNMTTINKALGDKNGTFKFLKSTVNYGDHRLIANQPLDATNKDAIIVTTLDDVLAELSIPIITFLKIDVQGNEVRVLRGARQTLSRSQKVIIKLEYTPYLLKYAGLTHLELYDELISQGFSLSLVDGEKIGKDYFENTNKNQLPLSTEKTMWFVDIIAKKGY